MMNLRFKAPDIKNRGRALTYDDVLLVPEKSEVLSRKDPDLTSQLTKTKSIKLPFISANMDTITEHEMAYAMDQLGGIGILHRFMTIEQQAEQVKMLVSKGVTNIAASVGVNIDDQKRAEALVAAGANILTIDIAHGHSQKMMDTTKRLKDSFDGVEVIAGNVATPEATVDLIKAGADTIKVGIGPGSMCTTRIITGCGVPQLTAVALCAEAAKEYNVPVIADGGIKTSGDIVKAFAAGAQTVMLGSLLSGTMETPGEVKSGKKQYRGMASKSAQVSWRGELPSGMAAEGEAVYVSIKGHAHDVVNELAGGLRSGMSYVNSMKVSDIFNNASFVEMSPMGFYESKAHGASS